MLLFTRLYEKSCYYFLGLLIYSMYGKKKKAEYQNNCKFYNRSLNRSKQIKTFFQIHPDCNSLRAWKSPLSICSLVTNLHACYVRTKFFSILSELGIHIHYKKQNTTIKQNKDPSKSTYKWVVVGGRSDTILSSLSPAEVHFTVTSSPSNRHIQVPAFEHKTSDPSMLLLSSPPQLSSLSCAQS